MGRSSLTRRPLWGTIEAGCWQKSIQKRSDMRISTQQFRTNLGVMKGSTQHLLLGFPANDDPQRQVYCSSEDTDV